MMEYKHYSVCGVEWEGGGGGGGRWGGDILRNKPDN